MYEIKTANYPSFWEDFGDLLDSVQKEIREFSKPRGYDLKFVSCNFALAALTGTLHSFCTDEERVDFLDFLFEELEKKGLLPEGYRSKTNGRQPT